MLLINPSQFHFCSYCHIAHSYCSVFKSLGIMNNVLSITWSITYIHIYVILLRQQLLGSGIHMWYINEIGKSGLA